MAEQQKNAWKFGKRDIVFLAIIVAVVIALLLGTTERKTIAVPSDDVHRTATSKAACMACHDSAGVYPQPSTHTKMERCFLCHTQPKGWVGAPK
ncbi:MAG: hypothetical protein Q9M17_08935 [Mariprofundus sp.]|nr:hypothetical protein [Mariprofundus sp.]